MGSVNVRVGLDEVVAESGSELLGRVDGVLLGKNVDSLLLGVCGNDGAVVGFGVAVKVSGAERRTEICSRGLDIALEESADGLLNDGVDTSLLVLIYLVQTDIVLAVLCVAELRHCDEFSEK